MPGRNFVLAFSGGLDTSYGLAVLVDRGEQVTTVTVNTGGFDEAELADIELRARELGAVDHVVIDGRERLYDQFVSYILKANYLRNGVYPSCVGVERMLQAEEVTRVALERGADAIAVRDLMRGLIEGSAKLDYLGAMLPINARSFIHVTAGSILP